MTDVHLYSLTNAAYFADDMQPDSSIGKQLLSLHKRWGDAKLVLTDESYVPVLMKLDGRVYDFGYFSQVRDKGYDLWSVVPTDSYWNQLREKETIVVKPEDIEKRVNELVTTHSPSVDVALSEMVATDLLRYQLRARKKEVAVFMKDNGKLATLSAHSDTGVHVEERSWDFSELAKELGSRGSPLPTQKF